MIKIDFCKQKSTVNLQLGGSKVDERYIKVIIALWNSFSSNTTLRQQMLHKWWPNVESRIFYQELEFSQFIVLLMSQKSLWYYSLRFKTTKNNSSVGDQYYHLENGKIPILGHFLPYVLTLSKATAKNIWGIITNQHIRR